MEEKAFCVQPAADQCAMCGEKFQPNELTAVAGELICNDCLHDFCEEI